MNTKKSRRRPFLLGSIFLCAMASLNGCGNQNDNSYQPEGQLEEELSVFEREQSRIMKENASMESHEGTRERIGTEER